MNLTETLKVSTDLRYKTISFYRILFTMIIEFLLWALSVRGNPIWIQSIIYTISFCGVVFIIFEIVDIIKTKLILTEIGIEFQKPFFKLSCNWEAIEKYNIENGVFDLFCSAEVNQINNLYARFFVKSRNCIPVGSFVKSWWIESDWETDPVLIILNRYKPGLLWSIRNK